MKFVKMGLIIVSVLVLGGSIALASSIPDGSGVIHGCYNNNGVLRVIDLSNDSCHSTETPLTWSQTGPTGATGATGATGPAGFSNVHYVSSSLRTIGVGQSSFIVNCGSGELPLGSSWGLAEINGNSPDWSKVTMVGDSAKGDETGRPNGWIFGWDNQSGFGVGIYASVICVNGSNYTL